MQIRVGLILFCVGMVMAMCQGFRLESRVGYKQSRASINMKFDLNRAVNTLASNRILTQTAQLGLLTRLEKAGFTPSSAIPLLKLADKYDVVGILESSSDKVLPLVAKGIELAPQLLPLASKALKIPSSTLFVGAAASAAAAVGLLYVVPDDSVVNIALQTALFVPLGLVAPGGLAVGGIVLDKINGKGK